MAGLGYVVGATLAGEPVEVIVSDGLVEILHVAHAAAPEAHTPVMSSVRGGVKSECRGPSYPPDSTMSTVQIALHALPAPDRRSWSKRGPFWPFRSMWKSAVPERLRQPVGAVQAGHDGLR